MRKGALITLGLLGTFGAIVLVAFLISRDTPATAPQDAARSAHVNPPIPNSDYTLPEQMLVADSAEDFATLADAAIHHDHAGVSTLEGEGKAMTLERGTRIYWSKFADGVCDGSVESGPLIGKNIYFACSQISATR